MTDPVDDYFRRLRPSMDLRIESHVTEILSGVRLQHRSALDEMFRGGKRVRGILVCLVAETLGGSVERALPRAVAVELIQAASLLHDDVIDQDAQRRGLPALWTLEGTRRAILVGDVLFASAIRMACQLGARDGALVAEAIAKVSQGACNEPLEPLPLARAVENGALPPGLYEDIIDLKTGILFGTACQLGALAADAQDAMTDRLHLYGRRLGQAYQIADDLMDLEHLPIRKPADPHRLAPLVPALLRFAGGAEKAVPAVLQGQAPHRTVRTLIRETLTAMAQELERRVASAVEALDGTGTPEEEMDLLRRAPVNVVDQLRQTGEVRPSWPTPGLRNRR